MGHRVAGSCRLPQAFISRFGSAAMLNERNESDPNRDGGSADHKRMGAARAVSGAGGVQAGQ